MVTLAEQITHLRKECKMSQEELAEALQVSRQSVSKWENGQSNPDTENLIRLAEIFQVDVNLLIGSQLQPEEEPAELTPAPPTDQRKTIRLLSVLLALFISTSVLFAVLWGMQQKGEHAEPTIGLTSGEPERPWQTLHFYVGEAHEEIDMTLEERKELYQLVRGTDSEEWTITENPEKIDYEHCQYLVEYQAAGVKVSLIFTKEELRNVQVFPSGRTMLYCTPITSQLLDELQRYAEK